MPVPRGKNDLPTRDSITELLPELCRVKTNHKNLQIQTYQYREINAHIYYQNFILQTIRLFIHSKSIK